MKTKTKHATGWKEFLKPSINKIAIVVVLFIFLLLGFYGVSPFGKTVGLGDVVTGEAHPALIAPPTYLRDHLYADGIVPFLLAYYYLISCLIIYGYRRIKQ